MTVIAVTSVKHSPGATTLGLALVAAVTATRPGPDHSAVLIEADPAGGDLAGRIGLSAEPGLASLAASARHPGSAVDVAAHGQPLPCGGAVVLGPTSPELADGAVRTLADRLVDAARSFELGVIDCGRWSSGSPAAAILARSDWTVVVVRPDLSGVDHLLARLDALRRISVGGFGIAMLGDHPYGAAAVAEVTGCPNVIALAVDPDGVEALHGGRRMALARKCRLVRSARSVLDAITPAHEVVPA